MWFIKNKAAGGSLLLRDLFPLSTPGALKARELVRFNL